MYATRPLSRYLLISIIRFRLLLLASLLSDDLTQWYFLAVFLGIVLHLTKFARGASRSSGDLPLWPSVGNIKVGISAVGRIVVARPRRGLCGCLAARHLVVVSDHYGWTEALGQDATVLGSQRKRNAARVSESVPNCFFIRAGLETHEKPMRSL